MSDVSVIGEADNGRHLLQIIDRETPDMAIVDISMPKLNGFQAAYEIAARYPSTAVMILTMHKRVDFLKEAFAAGVRGYLLKEDSDQELIAAIDTIRTGGTYITQKLSGHVMRDGSGTCAFENPTALDFLSSRERQIFHFIIEGKKNREIADALYISVRTVENHRASIMKKLNVPNTTSLIKFAHQNGLIA
jgi:DNA-binding NarL/FixJ family response regulator